MDPGCSVARPSVAPVREARRPDSAMREHPARPIIDEGGTAWTPSTPTAVGLINDGVHEGAIRTGRDAQRGGHCHRDQRGIGEGRERVRGFGSDLNTGEEAGTTMGYVLP